MRLLEFLQQFVGADGKPLAVMYRRTETDGKARDTIIAASVYAVQPATLPYRVVLRFQVYKDAGGIVGKFIVHNQVMETDENCHRNAHGDLDHQFANSSWDRGDYFGAEQYPAAYARFVERCQREVDFHGSLMRVLAEPEVLPAALAGNLFVQAGEATERAEDAARAAATGHPAK